MPNSIVTCGKWQLIGLITGLINSIAVCSVMAYKTYGAPGTVAVLGINSIALGLMGLLSDRHKQA